MFLLLFPLFLLGGLLYGRKRTNMQGWTAEHLKGWEYYIKKRTEYNRYHLRKGLHEVGLLYNSLF